MKEVVYRLFSATHARRRDARIQLPRLAPSLGSLASLRISYGGFADLLRMTTQKTSAHNSPLSTEVFSKRIVIE